MTLANPWIIASLLVLTYLASCIRVIREYERAVVFRLGRVLTPQRTPGIFLLFWPIYLMQRVSLRTIVEDVPSQDVITRDNVSVEVNAVVYYRVVHPILAVLEVEDYIYATSQLSQTTLRSVIGQVYLDELLVDRERINGQIQVAIDEQASAWGIEVQLGGSKFNLWKSNTSTCPNT